jgi:hypothetical protein
VEIVIVVSISVVLGFLSYGFYQWIDKVDLERKYLQSLLKEQEKDRNVLRKNI